MTPTTVREQTRSSTHAPPFAGERCDLWVTLKTRHVGTGTRLGLSSDWPSLFLHFRATGLLVALPDEDPALMDVDDEAVTLRLLATDGLGLGLTAADFAEGVGLCGGAGLGGHTGWRCRSVTVLGVDDTERERVLDEPTLVEEWLR